MGELKDPAKHGAHAQRLQELRAKGLGEGGALRDRAGSTTRTRRSPVISPNRVLEARPVPGLEKPGVHPRR